MIEGSDQLDTTSCDTLEPLSGFNPETQLIFVRNPDYDQATDDSGKNLPDRFEFKINSNNDDCFNRIKEAMIEDNICSETGKIIKEYSEDRGPRGQSQGQSGRRRLVPLDEPLAAALRRHPCAQGRELRHGQDGLSAPGAARSSGRWRRTSCRRASPLPNSRAMTRTRLPKTPGTSRQRWRR